MSTIAVIDDDVYIGDMIERVLIKEGYKVLRAYSGTEALLLLDKNHPDLILLDLMLPGMSGEEVLPKIADIPVIVVSAKVDVQDKVNVLLDGAADYITKPFHVKELLARITVQLRLHEGGKGTAAESEHAGEDKKSALTFKELSLDTNLHEARADGESVRLTKTEYAILKLLIKNPKQVITKSAMLERICEDTPDGMESSLKVHISNLRKKLRDISGHDYIEAVWGIGFKLREEEKS